MTQQSHSIVETLDREIVAVLVAVTILAVALLPANAAALTAWIALFAWSIAIMVVRRGVRGSIAPPVRWLLAVGGLAVVLAFGSSFSAVNPVVSLFGSLGQHTGSLIWVGALGLVIVSSARARRGDLGRITRAVAVGSAFVAISALLDAAGIWSTARFSVEPAGIMENSISLAQVLVLGVFSSVAWGVARKGGERLLATGTAVMSLAAIFVADARAAWVGAAIGLLFALYAALSVRGGWARPLLTGVFIGVVLVVLLSAGWALLGDSDVSEFERTLERVSNDRTIIWSGAYAQAAAAPLLGEGAEQFSVWVTWSSQPGVSLFKSGAYDPHNMLLWWLLAAGIPGVCACILFVALLAARLHETVVVARGSYSVAAVAGGLCALGVMWLLSWVSPLALLFAAPLVGGLLGAGITAEKSDASGPFNVTAYAAAIVALVALVSAFTVGSALQEYQWAAQVDDGAVDVAFALDAAANSGDPSLAAQAVISALEQSSANPALTESLLDLDERIVEVIERDAQWHVDLAFERFELAAMRAGMTADPAAFDEAEAAIAAGKRADPMSGLWDYVAAAQFAGFGETGLASSYARSALEHDLPVEVRSYLIELAGGQ